MYGCTLAVQVETEDPAAAAALNIIRVALEKAEEANPGVVHELVDAILESEQAKGGEESISKLLRIAGRDLPEYDFDTLKPLKKGEVAKLVLAFEPSATYFCKGDELRLVVQGRYFISGLKINQPFTYKGNERGRCNILSSAKYVSELLLPVIEK